MWITRAGTVSVRSRLANRVAGACLASLVVGLVGQDTNKLRSDRPPLRGRVIDAQRQPVAGAIVLLKSSGQRQAIMTMTARDGQYKFWDLSAGIDYELRAEHESLSSVVTPLRVSDPQERVFIELQVVPQIQFDEISEQAGINFTLRNAAEGYFHMPETMVAGVAALDYNNDGCTDIYWAWLLCDDAKLIADHALASGEYPFWGRESGGYEHIPGF